MAKRARKTVAKTAQTPPPHDAPEAVAAPDPSDNPADIQLKPSELLEMVRGEHAAETARLKLQVAHVQERTLRMETAQTLQAAQERVRAAMQELEGATKASKAVAQQMADRYHFDWSTHAYSPETGTIRPLGEE